MVFLNTWLMHPTVRFEIFGRKVSFTIEEKPVWKARREELGWLLSAAPTRPFGIVALAELWSPNEDVPKILSRWVGTPPTFIRGPGRVVATDGKADIFDDIEDFVVDVADAIADAVKKAFDAVVDWLTAAGIDFIEAHVGKVLGSGLGMLIGPRVKQAQVTHYQYKHFIRHDPETLAGKGVLHAELQLTSPDGRTFNIDWYVTHLTTGSADVKLDQVRELRDFINETHDKRNVAILVGDFNIAAREGDHPGGAPNYKQLRAILGEIGLIDRWSEDYGPGWTVCGCGDSGTAGLGQIAPPHPSVPVAADDLPLKNRAEGPSTVCPNGKHETPIRIDYLFVERPTATHTYDLDLVRPYRARFPRRDVKDAFGPAHVVEDAASVPFVSDHLGLASHVIVNPR